MKTSTIIDKLKTTFARNGIPMNFLSDNAQSLPKIGTFLS